MSALSWSAATQATGLGLRFGIMIIMARLLGPAEFGLFAMLAVFTGFARQLIGQGLGASLIQKQDVRPEHLDTVFWTNVSGGALAAGILAACAPLIADFYGQPELVGITVIVGLNLFISSGQLVQGALLTKQMDFRTGFWIDTLTSVISGVAAIAAAMHGYGVWALVIDLCVGNVTKLVLLWQQAAWSPRFRFDFALLRQISGFSGNLALSQILGYWSRNLDTLLVGKFFGEATAGIYNRAYQLMMLPMTQLIGVVHRVMFPALSSIQHDLPRVRTVYLRATRVVALLAFPMILILLVLAEPTILFLYGEKWRASIGIFQILCPAALYQTVGSTANWLYLSQGRTDRLLRWQILATPVSLAAFIVGLQWGVRGMAAAYVLSGYLILLYPSWAIPGKLVGLSFRAMVRNIRPTLLCAMAAASLVWLMDRLMATGATNFVRLSLGGALGAAVYLGLLIRFKVAAWQDVCGLIHSGHLPGGRLLARFMPSFAGEPACTKAT